MMDNLRKFIRDVSLVGLLLLSGAMVGGFVAVGGYLVGQPVSGDVREFKWLEARCWFEPCSIESFSRFPWEGFSAIKDLPPVSFPVSESMAVGQDNSLIVRGKEGQVYRSPPPYAGWDRLAMSPELRVDQFYGSNEVAVGPDGTIVIVGEGGVVYRAVPPYRDWVAVSRLESIGPEMHFEARSVAVGPNGAIVALAGRGLFVRAVPPYVDWESIPAPSDLVGEGFLRFRSMAVGSDSAIVVMDDRGVVYRAVPPYADWESIPAPSDLVGEGFLRFHSMAVGSDSAIVVMGDRGRLYRALPPYENWDYLPLPYDFLEATSVAFGPRGRVAAIRDNGIVNAWVTVTPPLFAWVLLTFLILSVVLAVPPLVRTWHRIRAPQDIIPLESDVPIEDPKQATEAAKELANRISAFLRNPDAPAPLTFALTGRWGSGKSSLMKLVERELTKDRCPCVWFNAWHHQNETHLFAALMESIRTRAIPQSPLGYFEFYINLVSLRFSRRRTAVIAFLTLAVVVLLLFLVTLWRIYLDIDWTGSFTELVGSTTAEVLGPFALLVLGFLGLTSRRNPLRAFGVTPASLLRTSVAWFKLPDFRSRLSFRHQFGSAFGEVCDALGDRRLVIIIDDLDRCRPDQVALILEAVNFLTSSGDCFVLLGIDVDHVRCAVGLHYHDLAAELSQSTRAESNNGGSAHANRWSFAGDYLEKVINITIQVPAVGMAELQELRERSGGE